MAEAHVFVVFILQLNMCGFVYVSFDVGTGTGLMMDGDLIRGQSVPPSHIKLPFDGSGPHNTVLQ